VPLVGHGIGGRLDLPVPTSFFAAGAAVVLIITFVALAALWPRPRLQDGPLAATPGRRVGLGPFRFLGFSGLVVVVLAGLAALATGTDQVGSRNIGPVLLWVYFWLLIPFASAFTGNLYTGINPWRSLSGWLGIGERERPELVRRVGLWPAAALLLALAWMELVYPDSGSPASIGIAALVYTAFLLTLIGRFGREAALTSFDPFSCYNRLISSIGPLGRNQDGRLIRRGWLRALPTIPEWNGLPVFLVTMIGTVSFDGLSGTSWWASATGFLGASIAGMTLLLVAMCGVICGGYYLACLAAARVGGGNQTASHVASRFAHTLVPIALAYAFAHYFTLVIFEGQSIISAVSDPFGLGWDMFGTRTYKINFFLGALPVWYIQVATIVIGHVAAVVLAHDRALVDFRGAGAVRSQYAMLVLMVLLTGLGLFILAG
jgi:hypothetical protein